MSEPAFINYILVPVLGAVVAIIILYLIRSGIRLVEKYNLKRLIEKIVTPDFQKNKVGISPMSHTDYFKTDDNGRTILFFHAATGNLAEVEKLIFSLSGTGISPQRLSLISHKDKEGLTSADVAEQNGHEEIARLLRSEQGRMEFFE